MNISCIVTDDEPIARRGLQNYVERIPFLQLRGVCEDAIQLTSLLQQEPVDLLFLDIEMPFLTGIEFLKSARQTPKVIITTAYESYALQGFELDVVDYLLKPISFERFLKAANKAAELFTTNAAAGDPYIFIKTNGRLERIIVQEILCVEALENYVAIHTTDKKWLAHLTLKNVHEQLPQSFIQSHKSWLVNTDHVTAVENTQLTCGGKTVPLSKQHRDLILQKIVEGKMLKRG